MVVWKRSIRFGYTLAWSLFVLVLRLLVFVPLVIWLTVVLARRVPNPFLTLVVIGFAYGVMLAIGHQKLWVAAWDGNSPSLGGNLEGVLVPGLEAVVFRMSAFFSSLMTGTLVGAVVGLVAWAIERAAVMTRRARKLHP
jgi:hypothetical protein